MARDFQLALTRQTHGGGADLTKGAPPAFGIQRLGDGGGVYALARGHLGQLGEYDVLYRRAHQIGRGLDGLNRIGHGIKSLWKLDGHPNTNDQGVIQRPVTAGMDDILQVGLNGQAITQKNGIGQFQCRLRQTQPIVGLADA